MEKKNPSENRPCYELLSRLKKEVPLRTTHNEPVAIKYEKTIVSYRFSSTPSDVSFGIIKALSPCELVLI